MDGMFFVNDDIDLSDDDFGLDLSKVTQQEQLNSHNNKEAEPSTAPRDGECAATPGSGMCNTAKSLNNNKFVEGKEKLTSKFFSNDDDDLFDDLDCGDMDKLLSQIDIPAIKKKTSSSHFADVLCTPKQTNSCTMIEQRTDLSGNQESCFSNKSFPKKRTGQALNKDDFCIANKLFVRGPGSTSSNCTTTNKHSSDRPTPFFQNNNTVTPEKSKVKQIPCQSSASSSIQQNIQKFNEERTPCRTSSAFSAPRSVNTTPLHSSTSTTPNVLSRSNKHRSALNSHEKPRQRRFPGPAGILPALNSMTSLDQLKSPDNGKIGKRTLTPVTPKTPLEGLLSSSQDEDFDGCIWLDVQNTVRRMFPHRSCDSISKVLREAMQNQLKNSKVAILCGLVKSFSTCGSGGKLTLKDPSGEMNGTIHNNVLEEYEPDLRAGTGLILKDVSVFSPNIRKHYVNITPANIVQVFPAEIPEMQSTQTQSTQVQQNETHRSNNNNSSNNKHVTKSDNSNQKNNNQANHHNNHQGNHHSNHNWDNNNNNNHSNMHNNNLKNININMDRRGKENQLDLSGGVEQKNSVPNDLISNQSGAGGSGMNNQASGFFEDDDSDEMILSCIS